MSAISELIGYAIYIFLVIGSITFFVSAWLSKVRSWRIIHIVLGTIFMILCIAAFISDKNSLRKWELEHVGIYYLDKYPNCIDCRLELKANNTFTVSDNNKILEKGDWHFEVGGDYFIVYMNDKNDQLGSGRFTYTNSSN